MLHTASLVHDDVLDECDVRRGANKPTTARANSPALLPCFGGILTCCCRFCGGQQRGVVRQVRLWCG